MSLRNRIYLVVLFATAVLLTASVIRYFHGRSALALGAGMRTKEAVAFKFGQVIKERLPGTDPVLVVQLPPVDAAAAKRAKYELAALVRGLGGNAKSVVVVSPKQLPAGGVGGLAMRSYDGHWGEEFLTWLAPHPRARAVVSFMGFPSDLPESLPQQLPPVLAVYYGSTQPATDWLTQRKAFALAELRPDANLGDDPGSDASPEDIFDARYTLAFAQ